MAGQVEERPPSYDREVGQRVHQLLAEYGRRRERPPVEVVFADAVQIVKDMPFYGRRRPGPQRLATLTAVGLELIPPIAWTLIGSELQCQPGRVDLAWEAPPEFQPAPGVVIFDELKAGAMPGHLRTGEVTEQVERYVRFGQQAFGARFAGVRLVALSLPGSSVFYRPSPTGAVAVPLLHTHFWFGPRPGETH